MTMLNADNADDYDYDGDADDGDDDYDGHDDDDADDDIDMLWVTRPGSVGVMHALFRHISHICCNVVTYVTCVVMLLFFIVSIN